MSRSLTSIVLRDEQHQDMGHVRYIPLSGWLWACSLCPAGTVTSAGAPAPEAAVEHLVDHIGRAHP